MQEPGTLLERVRAQAPLTLVITNQVTIGDCANALLAIGAAPVMSSDPEDARDLAALASATVLNIGTVCPAQMEVLLAAGRSAKAEGRPVVLDPVGAGATATRRSAVKTLLAETAPDIIRGNWSEIQALAGLKEGQKGVDSTPADDLEMIAGLAGNLARRLGTVVAVTGATDVVAADRRTWLVRGGSPLLTRLTGTGCLLSALTGAYAGAARGDPVLAALSALAHLALAGELAAADLASEFPEPTAPGIPLREEGQQPPYFAPGPRLGSFKVKLFDGLARISPEELGQPGRIEAL